MLRIKWARIFGMRIAGGARACAFGRFQPAIVLLMVFVPSALAGQVNAPAGDAPSVPQSQQKSPPEGERTPDYSVVHKLTSQAPPSATPEAATGNLRAWEGLQIGSVEFEGVTSSRLGPIVQELAVQPHTPLRSEDVRQSLRTLFATGLYKGVAVEGERQGNSVVIRFSGPPQYFVGRVTVEGLKSDRLAGQLERSTRLTAGTRYDDAKMKRTANLLKETLENDGYYLATFSTKVTEDKVNALANITYQVKLGERARVGKVELTGDSGLSEEQFRKKAKLKADSKVNRDTVSRALNNLRKYYEKKNRLEATIALESKQFRPSKNLLDFKFKVDQGPLVSIHVQGVDMSRGKLKSLVPVYEEGTVDEDLLNEGDKRIRDYYQREGYFDAKVTHSRKTEGTGASTHTQITFQVELGARQKVESVAITGNQYFGDDVIRPRLSVEKATLFLRHGRYSQALAQADADTIEALYQSNGFSNVSVTPVVKTGPKGSKGNEESISVNYEIDEGKQDLIGKYEIVGANKVPLSTLKPLLSTEAGQPYSATTIMGDRDAIVTYYYSHGFDHAAVKLSQRPEQKRPDRIDVTLQVTEGEQIFVNKVVTSGLHYTRVSTVEPHILLQPGEPLNQSALLESQRQLYDLTLFNEVNTAVQNPRGENPRKNVLVQFTEAKRWDLSYGVGFQAQTGNPSTSCPNPVSLIQLGIDPADVSCGPNGKTGASALVLFDISRINLWGRNQSITLRTEYGSLEQTATTIYSFPHIFNLKSLDFSLSGGYTNAQDVTTYAASRLEGTVRFTHRLDLANTLFYQFTYRRVKVDPNSVQVSPNEIPLVSEPVRVGGPGITWIRDTRRPSPLDATAGTYTSLEDFATDNVFASEANFNRLDLTNSSYYQFGKRHYVFARDTRFGYERAFGQAKYEYIPLPERLYAGGAQSLRAYSINAAGPRDSLTGFPVGGAGVFINSSEMRFPNPTLPYVGNALGFVLFHDMGNVFNNSSDIWPSILRIKQPHSWTCRDLNADHQKAVTRSSSTNSTGTCDFNYFTHDVGLGLRYHTPIGPIRLDFSYTLNPPIYPVIITYGTHSDGSPIGPHVEQAPHFNFFFSIGQAF